MSIFWPRGITQQSIEKSKREEAEEKYEELHRFFWDFAQFWQRILPVEYKIPDVYFRVALSDNTFAEQRILEWMKSKLSDVALAEQRVGLPSL